MAETAAASSSGLTLRITLGMAAAFCVACCCLAALRGDAAWSPLAAGLAGLAAAQAMSLGLTGRGLSPTQALQDLLAPGLLAASVSAALPVWQIPLDWPAVLSLSGPGGLLACGIYLGALAYALTASGRHPGPVAGLCLLAVPYLFNWLLALDSPGLVTDLGRLLDATGSPAAVDALGRAALLTVLNEVVAVGIGLGLTGRLLRDWRVHVLLAACAAYAALTPLLSSLGSGPAVAALPGPLGPLAALAATVACQAGLWAEVFLVTGMILDALQGKPPTWYWDRGHARGGLTKGAVYSAVFMALVLALAGLLAAGLGRALAARPLLGGALVGAAAFPLAMTIIETFDGSSRFFARLGRKYLHWTNLLRGVLLGLGAAVALDAGLPGQPPPDRFAFGLAVGAAAYGGADLVRDAAEVWLRRRRERFQPWRVYALGACLGAAVGGAVAWYFDALQLAVVIGKFAKYAALSMPAEDYVIYPLFNKWGAMDLGAVDGGARLLYAEALSGVINWSLAAPLFSVNLVLLTALFTRSSLPIRRLATRQGLAGLVEQGVRVLRWGLWMAPIISSFLRMAPDPTWYNQDGALRTLAAIYKGWTVDPGTFRAWSLSVFVTLLVKDWFRVLLWIDHMGLRVATLVNLSFVGGDALDEKAARFLGHSARTRAIPEGIRRFGTWAPLLIPFYLPRGADWDYAWGTMETLRAAAGSGAPPSVAGLAGLALALALGAGVAAALTRPRAPAETLACGHGPGLPDNRSHLLGNGVYTLEALSDGRAFSRAFSPVRQGQELDLTRRPDDALHLTGKFIYLTDLERAVGDPQRHWSLGYLPCRLAGPDAGATRLDASTLRLANTFGKVRAEALVRVDPADPVETWTVRLTNLEDRPRSLDLTTFREWTMQSCEAHRRHPAFGGLHVGTCFVRSLGAILARNRLLTDPSRGAGGRGGFSRETGFHAAAEAADGSLRLVGYEDSRPRFIGAATLAGPEGLDRDLEDPSREGLRYTFDPAACLRLRLELPARGSLEVRLADGLARDVAHAARLIRRHLGASGTAADAARAMGQTRPAGGFPVSRRTPGPAWSFSRDGRVLTMPWDTPRPWAHVMANPLGYGLIVANDGSAFSFMGNAQQNGLTPFELEGLPCQNPGQVIYVTDLDTGEVDAPTFVPHRRAEDRHLVAYGLGWAAFRKRRGELDMDMTVFVPPDQPAEVRLLRLRNQGKRPLRLRITPCFRIMLGEIPADSQGTIRAFYDQALEAQFFSNPNNDFRKGWAFCAMSLPVAAQETVLARFVGGPGRDLREPCLARTGRPEPGRPDDGLRVAALCGELTVPVGGEVMAAVVLGQAETVPEAAAIIRALREPEAAALALERTRRWWTARLSALRLETGHRAFDRLVNDWLPYQVLVSRLWGRCGPSQRSGAFGYRDQLQDVLPMLWLDPALARSQILLHAGAQFPQGDVLQWWHLSWEGRTGLGMRNRIADAPLWLPYVLARYVAATGDHGLLEEQVPFLEGRPIPDGEDGLVFAPRFSREQDTVLGHCVRAIDLTLSRFGRHGLPLIGTGDWNDGFNRVGRRGRGESVWLGFMLHDVLTRLAPLCQGRRRRYLRRAEALRLALDNMWRSDRYVRAIADNGQEMVKANALVSAWPALSGAAEPKRCLQALETGLAALERGSLVVLLTPPYHEGSRPWPGRIAEYPPGVRENGGQYSHGVSWLVDALAALADEAATKGRAGEAAALRERAARLWLKISQAELSEEEALAVYGLPPHQQPADVYAGQGHEGRGGWSWYTGSAARMLCAAYALLGLGLENGEPVLAADAAEARGPLRLRRVVWRGRELPLPGPAGRPKGGSGPEA